MKEELPFTRLVPFPSRTSRHPQAGRPVNDQWKARQAVATKEGSILQRPWQERAKLLLQSRLPSPPLSGGLMARSSPETRQLSFNFSAFLAANWPCQMARPPMFVYPDDDGGDAGCALIDGFLRAGDGGCHCHCFFPYFFPILFLLFSSRGAAVSPVSPPGFASFDPRFVRDPKLLFRAAVARSHPPRVLKRRQI